MAISVERTHFERGSCLEALMFHCRWHPQEHHAIKYNTQFTCTCPILLCVIFFEGFFLNVFSVFTCGCGCGYVFLLNGCLCFFILGWIIILLLMDNIFFCNHVWKDKNVGTFTIGVHERNVLPQNHFKNVILNDHYTFEIIYLVDFIFIRYSHISWSKWWWFFVIWITKICP
jgi:hypothetical protein